MKIVCISDTHGLHQELELPEGDMIVHSGDFSKRGQIGEVREFLNWFSSLPYRHKVFIAGNHDFLAEQQPTIFRRLIPENCIYLENEGVRIEGIHIWGSPITPWFFAWAFNRRRGEAINQYWEMIPEDVDILLTHGPAYRILDKTARGDYVGCEDLLEQLDRIQPRLHVFGHIHEAYGSQEQNGCLHLNASVLDLSYRQVNQPVLVQWGESLQIG